MGGLANNTLAERYANQKYEKIIIKDTFFIFSKFYNVMKTYFYF